MNVPAVSYSIVYDGRDITKNISQYIKSVTYTDALEGQSDEVQIVLDDSSAVWQNAWYPDKGSILKVTIGSMNCGEFQIDESGKQYKNEFAIMQNLPKGPEVIYPPAVATAKAVYPAPAYGSR